jgi:riboflavin synthase
MFSGIIEEVGTVVSYDGETLVVSANQVLDDLKISESIMVAGACLTVTELAEDGSTFTVETVPETRTRANYGDLESGDSVNLERALRYGDRVGGHMVQGHVDGVGTVRSVIEDGNSRVIVIEAPTNIIASRLSTAMPIASASRSSRTRTITLRLTSVPRALRSIWKQM